MNHSWTISEPAGCFRSTALLRRLLGDEARDPRGRQDHVEAPAQSDLSLPG